MAQMFSSRASARFDVLSDDSDRCEALLFPARRLATAAGSPGLTASGNGLKTTPEGQTGPPGLASLP